MFKSFIFCTFINIDNDNAEKDSIGKAAIRKDDTVNLQGRCKTGRSSQHGNLNQGYLRTFNAVNNYWNERKTEATGTVNNIEQECSFYPVTGNTINPG